MRKLGNFAPRSVVELSDGEAGNCVAPINAVLLADNQHASYLTTGAGSLAHDIVVQLVKSGERIGMNLGRGDAINSMQDQSEDETCEYGENWNVSLTKEIIESNDFGVDIQLTGGSELLNTIRVSDFGISIPSDVTSFEVKFKAKWRSTVSGNPVESLEESLYVDGFWIELFGE